jgi:PadR family transcriptional regulator, regulatory protein PadR
MKQATLAGASTRRITTARGGEQQPPCDAESPGSAITVSTVRLRTTAKSAASAEVTTTVLVPDLSKDVDRLLPLGVVSLHPMAKHVRYQNRIELLQGTLDLIVLQTLQWGPQHGYGIAQAIQASSSDVLQVDTGSLYPALHRLERRKWIAATWKVSAHKQRTRVYRLTPAGRRQLASERSRWQTLVDAMTGILARPQEG